MKIAVRALVLGMLVTGFAASHMLATQTAQTSTTVAMTSSNSLGMPTCQPGTSTCGFHH